jgi:type VI secretion system secreted protein Hcp
MGIYMKYGNITGDATQKGFEGWLNIDSFGWGLHRQFAKDQVGRAFNREAAQANVKAITVTKDVDNASGALLEAASTASKGETCEIVFLRTGNPGEVYLQFTLTDTLLQNLGLATGGSERPVETMELDFTKVEITVKVLNEENIAEPDNMHIFYNIATGEGG